MLIRKKFWFDYKKQKQMVKIIFNTYAHTIIVTSFAYIFHTLNATIMTEGISHNVIVCMFGSQTITSVFNSHWVLYTYGLVLQ